MIRPFVARVGDRVGRSLQSNFALACSGRDDERPGSRVPLCNQATTARAVLRAYLWCDCPRLGWGNAEESRSRECTGKPFSAREGDDSTPTPCSRPPRSCSTTARAAARWAESVGVAPGGAGALGSRGTSASSVAMARAAARRRRGIRADMQPRAYAGGGRWEGRRGTNATTARRNGPSEQKSEAT